MHRSFGALFVEVVDIGLGDGCAVGWCQCCCQGCGVLGLMDKYWSTIGCHTSLVGVDVEQDGPLGRVLWSDVGM